MDKFDAMLQKQKKHPGKYIWSDLMASWPECETPYRIKRYKQKLR